MNNKNIHWKNLLNQKIESYSINGDNLTTSWSTIPLKGDYLQCKLHSKYADSGIEIRLNKSDSEILNLSDGMKYNRTFNDLEIRRRSVKGNSTKIIFYVGYFPNQIEQNTQVQFSNIVSDAEGLATNESYSKTIYLNCETAYIKINNVLTGGGTLNFDISMTLTGFNGYSKTIINETELINERLDYSVNCVGYKQLILTITNRHVNSLTVNNEITVK